MKQLLLTALLLGSISANASVVQGTSAGLFTNPTGEKKLVTSGVGSNHFTWGTPSISTEPPSSLSYVGNSFNVNENEGFVFGTLTFFNGTLLSGTGANHIDLDIDFNLNQPTNSTESFSFHLDLINTPNISRSAAENADFVDFNNTFSSSTLLSGNIEYTLEFIGFQNLNGDGFSVDHSFRVLENSSASVDLVGRLTSIDSSVSAVPVPAAVWLFGSSLIGLAGVRRKSSL